MRAAQRLRVVHRHSIVQRGAWCHESCLWTQLETHRVTSPHMQRRRGCAQRVRWQRHLPPLNPTSERGWWRATPPHHESWRAVAGEAGDSMDPGGFKRVGHGHQQQDGGEPPRQHRLPRPGWAKEERVWITRAPLASTARPHAGMIAAPHVDGALAWSPLVDVRGGCGARVSRASTRQ